MSLKGLVASDDEFHRLLRDFSLDTASFVGRYRATQQDLISDAERGLRSGIFGTQAARVRVAQFFGMTVELAARRSASGRSIESHELVRASAVLTQDPEALRIVHELYALDAAPGLEAIDLMTMSLHQVGTTSMIFKVFAKGLERRAFVLKLVHFFFAEVGPLASETRSYSSVWRPAGRSCPYVVDVVDSGDGWVLEEFIDGATLGEYLAEVHAAKEGYQGRLTAIERTFVPLVRALAAFHIETQAAHGDLSPSNIILQPRESAPAGATSGGENEPYVIRFIDMGRNLLASATIGRVRSFESIYIAPEVAAANLDVNASLPDADYYSLGVILGRILSPDDVPVADPVGHAFGVEPLLARVCADLIDSDPRRRIALIGASSGHFGVDGRLPVLAQHLSTLVRTLKKSGDNRLGSESVLKLAGIVTGLAITLPVASRFGPFTEEDRANLGVAERATIHRSAAALLFFTLGLIAVGYSALLDHGWDPLSIGSFARQLSYDPGDRARNWQVRVVAGSFLLASYGYLNIPFWRITFLASRARRWKRWGVELLLWSSPLLAAVVSCVALAVPHRWPMFASAALIVTLATNLLTASLRNEVRDSTVAGPRYADAAGLSESAGGVADLLSYWNPTLAIYSLMVSVLAFAVELGWADDMVVYAGAIALVNAVVFFNSQLVQQGPILRSSLGRVMIYGERSEVIGPS